MSNQMQHLRLPLLLLLLFLTISLSFCTTPAAAVVTMIASSEQLCVNEAVPPHSRVTFQFQVLSGGRRDIRAVLTDQAGEVLREWVDATEGIHEVFARDGAVAVTACLDNRPAHYTAKEVAFLFRYHVDYTAVAKQAELDPVEQKVEQISTLMRAVEALQMHLKSQQKEHRDTVDGAKGRLMMWSVFQVAALVVMSVFQLYFLKRFLERKSFL